MAFGIRFGPARISTRSVGVRIGPAYVGHTYRRRRKSYTYRRRRKSSDNGWLGALVSMAAVGAVVAFFAWPLYLVDRVAFPHPLWWGWALGGLAEAAWLSLLVAARAVQHRRTDPRRSTHG
jgi:hypothetical protein